MDKGSPIVQQNGDWSYQSTIGALYLVDSDSLVAFIAILAVLDWF